MELNPKERRRHKAIFTVCCLAVVSLTGVQTYRNFDLGRKLDKIEANTEHPPVVNVTTPAPKEHTHIAYDPPAEAIHPLLPFRVGQRPDIKITFTNTGDYQVLNPVIGGVVVVEKNTPRVNDIFPRLRKKIDVRHGAGAALDPYPRSRQHDGYIFEADKPLTDDDVKGLSTNMKILCALAVTDWHDNSGKYETTFAQCFRCLPGWACEWRVLDQHAEENKLP